MDVIWILEGDSRCLLQFLRQGHPSCRGQCGPEVEWSVCLFDSATKEFSVLTFDIQQTMSSFNYGGPLTYRAYQSITTCQYSMSIDMILTAGERGPSRSLNVGCVILCEPSRFLISGFR